MGAPDDRLQLSGEGDENDFLAWYGGWILIVGGVALTALAVIFRSATAISAEFGFLGPALIVLAVLLSRIEGPLSLSATGLRMVVRRMRRQIQGRARQDTQLPETKRLETAAFAEELAMEVVLETPPSREFAGTVANALYDQARSELLDFEERVKEWLIEQGLKVTADSREGAHQVDFVAQSSDELLYVEVKLTERAVTRGQLLSWLAQLLPLAAFEPNARVLLVVSAPGLTREGRATVERSAVEVYLARGTTFEQVN